MPAKCFNSSLEGDDDLSLSKLKIGDGKETETDRDHHQRQRAEVKLECNQDERCVAEIILPPEIWEKILLEVEQPLDLHQCLNTCQLWRTILKGSQSLWCLRSILPLVFPYLEKKDILNCRSACKYWTETVDATLENHEALRPLTGNSGGRHANCYHKSSLAPSPATWLMKWKELTSSYKLIRRNYPIHRDEEDDDPEDAIEDFDDDEFAELLVQPARWNRFKDELRCHPRNPLIGRSLTLEVDLSSTFPPHPVWDELLDLFNHVGRHLLISDIRIRHNPTFEMTAEALYFRLLHFLEETPQLRKLRFWYPRSKLTGDMKHQLFNLLFNRTKLPALANLDTLELGGSGTEVILDRVILKSYSDQLAKLQVDHWLPEYSKLSWSNLTELIIDQIWSEEHLLSILDLNCPKLRKLSINLNTKGQEQFRKLLEITNRFPTLLSFHFTMDYMCPHVTPEDIQALPPGLCAPPSLKILGVGHSYKISYDFLPRLPSIQCLHLVNSNVGMRDEDDETEIIEQVQVHGPLETGNMMESNIWQVLPNLEHVSLRERENSPTITTHWERRMDAK